MSNLCRLVVHNWTESSWSLGCLNCEKPSRGECILSDKLQLSGSPDFSTSGRYDLAPQVLILGAVMIRGALIALLVVSTGSTIWSLPSAPSTTAMHRSQEQQPKSESQPKKDDSAQLAKLTGCVDEQQGQWVLVNDQTMAIIANLVADGFPTEGFAKHVGHKVTVRGTSIPGSDSGKRPVFKVRSIET